LKGASPRDYFLVCKDVFDQSVYLEFITNRKMDTVLAFLVQAWQHLGLPEMVQFDNGREFCGFEKSARYFSRVIRLCLRLGVEPVFIPQEWRNTMDRSKTSKVDYSPCCCRSPSAVLGMSAENCAA
jgi:hypothetical protein